MFTDEEKKADDVLNYLEPNPNLKQPQLDIAFKFADLARFVLTLPRNPQRTMALNSLLDAKDRAVRASLPRA